MHNNKFTKETFWAVSVILICILAFGFLWLNPITQDSQAFPLFSNKKSIFLNIYNKQPTISGNSNIPSFDLPAYDTVPSKTAYGDIELSLAADATELTDSFRENSLPPYECPIDFPSLWEINEDVYAWITIPGTIINYPILQHKADDSYYLNYNIDGTEGFPGCIYTEKATAKDFSDNNTVIYGHNLRDGQMFTSLHKFRDPAFFNENEIIYVYTPEKEFTYRIFAAYIYDNRHLLNSFDFSDQKVYEEYLAEIQNMSSEEVNLRKDIQITGADKIITLITCTFHEPEKRVYVQAVLQQ